MRASKMGWRVFLFGFLGVAAESWAQQDWYWYNPRPRGSHIRAVQTVTQDLIFVAGDQGSIMKTTNAGATWQVLRSGVTVTLYGLSFINSTTGMAVGAAGTVLRTTDGGVSWRQLKIGTSNRLLSIAFINATTGTLVGDAGSIYRTTDGGFNWVLQYGAPSTTLNFVNFLNANEGTIVGAGGTILRTANGGASWNRQYSGVDVELDGVSFFSSAVGTAVGEIGTILRTEDGGVTWNAQQSGTRDHLRAVASSDFAIGTIGADNGTVLRTTDGGKSWNAHGKYTTAWFAAISFTNPNVGTIAGSFGEVYRTTDGGDTWRFLTPGRRMPMYGIQFYDNSLGMMVGNLGSILKTTDGGLSWHEQQSKVDAHLFAVGIADRDTVLCSSIYGRFLPRTRNGGNSWYLDTLPRVFPTDITISSIAFSSLTLGLVVGKKDTNRLPGDPRTRFQESLIWRTTDAGLTWSFAKLGEGPEFSCVRFRSPKEALVVGGYQEGVVLNHPEAGAIMRTIDGGLSWSTVSGFGSVPYLHSLTFNKGTLGIAVGNRGTILRTEDGGVSWTQQPSGTLNALRGVAFSGDYTAYAVGDSMCILRSLDGGLSWESLNVPWDASANAVTFIDPLHGFMIGDGGMILTTFAPPVVSVAKENGTGSSPTFLLEQNYPNPFNPGTAISYQLTALSHVNLEIYDVLGRRVAVLVDEMKMPGTYTVKWNGAGIPSSVYYYRLMSGGSIETKKMLYLR
ncbi:MAG: YCF48-related protein [Ignavibacteriales bacterium]|nr:YCF48-related protein [Ignavibacteriales bacterium]